MSLNPKSHDDWTELLKGNQTALKQIYMDYHKVLFQYGMRLLLDEAATKDCLHNLFVKIWSNRKNLHHTDNVKYYLMSTLRNEIINYKTKESRYDHSTAAEDVFLLDFRVESAYIRKEECYYIDQKLNRNDW